jgi:hypothetical protein
MLCGGIGSQIRHSQREKSVPLFKSSLHIKRFSCNFRVFPLPRYHRESPGEKDAHDLVHS